MNNREAAHIKPILELTLVQAHLYWQQPEANRAHIEELLAKADGVGDVIMLPEMFTTGFTMKPEGLAEPMNGTTCKWLVQVAKRFEALVMGSVITTTDSGRPANRLLMATPDGILGYYDKRHLFRMAGEHDVYQSGRRKVIIEWRGWRLLTQVCYDLRFPVWQRNRKHEEYDATLFVANWPSARQIPWETLLRARSIENLAYCAGVNRVGTDGNNLPYEGGSQVIFPDGTIIGHCGHSEAVLTFALHKESLDAFRQRFPAWMDADDFELKA